MSTAERTTEAAPATRAIAVAWRGVHRIALAFSLPDEAAAERAIEAACLRADTLARGFTLTRSVGGWRGAREHGAELALVGGHKDRYTLRSDAERITAELHAAGCECVQAELYGWAANGYEVEEWRPEA